MRTVDFINKIARLQITVTRETFQWIFRGTLNGDKYFNKFIYEGRSFAKLLTYIVQETERQMLEDWIDRQSFGQEYFVTERDRSILMETPPSRLREAIHQMSYKEYQGQLREDLLYREIMAQRAGSLKNEGHGYHVDTGLELEVFYNYSETPDEQWDSGGATPGTQELEIISIRRNGVEVADIITDKIQDHLSEIIIAQEQNA